MHLRGSSNLRALSGYLIGDIVGAVHLFRRLQIDSSIEVEGSKVCNM